MSLIAIPRLCQKLSVKHLMGGDGCRYPPKYAVTGTFDATVETHFFCGKHARAFDPDQYAVLPIREWVRTRQGA